MRQQGVGLVCHRLRLGQVPALRHVPILPQASAAAVSFARSAWSGIPAKGTGRAAQPERWAAGKTGTTSGHRDAWLIGFTERCVAGVWLGNTSAAMLVSPDGGPAGSPTGIFVGGIGTAHPDDPSPGWSRGHSPITLVGSRPLAGKAGRMS